MGRSRRDIDREPVADDRPVSVVTVCRSGPDRYVFLEAGNRDGWIATDRPVAIER